jgi:hypothetical protein
MISNPYEAMYGSLKQVVPTTSCLRDEAILNLQTEEWPGEGFKGTGNNDNNCKDTNKTNNEIRMTLCNSMTTRLLS